MPHISDWDTDNFWSRRAVRNYLEKLDSGSLIWVGRLPNPENMCRKLPGIPALFNLCGRQHTPCVTLAINMSSDWEERTQRHSFHHGVQKNISVPQCDSLWTEANMWPVWPKPEETPDSYTCKIWKVYYGKTMVNFLKVIQKLMQSCAHFLESSMFQDMQMTVR